jgi:hypothetical protein
MSRLIENDHRELIKQDNIISYIDESVELLINGDIYNFEYSIEYNKEIEEISLKLREKFYNILFSKNITFSSIFRKTIIANPSITNDKIPLYRPNLYFIYLILKNIINLKHSFELYKIINNDIILPSISDNIMLKSLIDNNIIKPESIITDADIFIMYIQYKKYNLIYDLKK